MNAPTNPGHEINGIEEHAASSSRIRQQKSA
jgi:hypothetical protein